MKNLHYFSFPVDKIIKLGFLYLLFPFCVFCATFLRIYYSIPIIIFLLWLFFRFLKSTQSKELVSSTTKDHIFFLIIAILLVLLSGIGGFTFQNSDFNGRNAIFRDLINNKWPVVFSNLGNASVPNSKYSLVYYFGYWLVPAIFGKLFGWKIANIVLFFSSIVGIILSGILLAKKEKTSLINSLLLLILFSGMDFIGVLMQQLNNPTTYPTIWPPITQLVWWEPIQFSFFTTQLFWVFNQAIPTLLCTLLILSSNDNRFVMIIWGLCFFFAPIPAIGLAVLIAARILNGFIFPESSSEVSVWKRIIILSKYLLSVENFIGGGLIIGITYLFFKANKSASSITLIHFSTNNIIILIMSGLLEWFIYWVATFKKGRKDISWYVMGPFFAVSEIIVISGTSIFPNRAPMAFLFLLMIWIGEIIFHENSLKKASIILFLIIGSLTPIYEINRSVYRTFQYYSLPPVVRNNSGQCIVSQTERLAFPKQPEYDHPNELTADDWYSLSGFDLQYLTSYVNDVSQSFFFNYLADK